MNTVRSPHTASFHANLLAPPLSQDRVTPNTSKLPYPLTASDDPESTSLLKHQTCRVLGNCRALQCPDAISPQTNRSEHRAGHAQSRALVRRLRRRFQPPPRPRNTLASTRDSAQPSRARDRLAQLTLNEATVRHSIHPTKVLWFRRCLNLWLCLPRKWSRLPANRRDSSN